MIRVEPIAGPNADTRFVAANMRVEDVEELWTLSRSRPQEAVEQSVQASTEAYVAHAAGRPIAVFGATVQVLSDVGIPWFLGTRDVDNHAEEYMRLGRRFTAHLLTRCEKLENMALSTNRRTLVFLSRMGFDIGEPFPVPGGEAVQFVMERKHV